MIELRALMRERIALAARLQTVIDGLVPPTTTGYLHAEESWTVAWVREGEFRVELEIALDPPDGAHEWNYVTVERLQTLQKQLGCDGVYGRALVEGKVRYIATYFRKEPS